MKSESRKILVTGGGGYIGSVAVGRLIKGGYKVTVLDTFLWGKKPLENFTNKIKIIHSDIRNITYSDLKGINSVIHTAGLSNDPMANFNPKANMEINYKATSKLAKLCKKSGVKRFIFASSASIYDKGLTNSNPIQDENSKVNPKAYYSISKYKAEQDLLKLTGNGFCPVILRQGTVFGFSPRMRYDLVVNTMVKDALSSGKIYVYCEGKEYRPLIDVTDVVEVYIKIIKSKEKLVSGQIFNLVYQNFNILNLAKVIRQVLIMEKIANPKIIVNNSKKRTRSYQISGEKIKKVLNWQPKVSIEKSVSHMVKKIIKGKYANYNHPQFYNIEWMKLLVDLSNILAKTKRVF